MHSEYIYPKIHDDIVQDFCNKCKDLNYHNNSSFESMKWYWGEVQWVGTFLDDVLVSLSGIHKFPEIDENAEIDMSELTKQEGTDNIIESIDSDKK